MFFFATFTYQLKKQDVMKKIISFCVVLLLVTSCTTYKIPYRRYSGTIDFSAYAQKGFFITESNSVSFSYEPLGSITAVVSSGYEVLNSEKLKSSDDVYGSFQKIKYGKMIDASVNDALDELYNSARSLGADGIINFRSDYIPATFQKGVLVSPDSYIVSGMAIRRR
jgi:uncharacterized protein YbjQ (UPF0145 family)